MFQDSNASSVVCLSKIAFENIPSGWNIKSKLHSCFKLFSKVLPFSSPLELETFFQFNHFENRTEINTVYGSIHKYEISNQLKQLSFQRSISLTQLCLLSLTEKPPSYFTVNHLLNLPVNLIQEFFILNFSVFWLPMSHILYHRSIPDETSPKSVQVVFSFLSDLHVFEKLYDSCRDLQMFMYSWMQHAHFYGVGGANSQINQCMNLMSKHPDYSPLVEPHRISMGLVLNLQEVLGRATRLKRNTAAEVAAAALLGLKIANFLCECSEYLHSAKAARAVHGTVREFFSLSRYHRTQLRLENEAMCIMLRSMNAYNMYLQVDDQQIFQKEAPNLLRAMRQADLLMVKVDEKNRSPFILPPNIEIVCEDLETLKSVPSRTSDETPSESTCSTSLSIIGPAGDISPSLLDSSPPIPAATISEFYFPTVRSNSEAVQNLLDDISEPPVSSAFLHAQLATYYYAMCKYDIAFQFTLLAVEQIELCFSRGMSPSPHVVIEVLRIMCKMCMIKRKYDLGLRIIQRALSFTKSKFGRYNLLYANILIEYGCLMLNTDKTRKAAEIYRVGLALILNSLPGASIIVALALEAIAYAHYVLEYTSGDFAYALNCAELAGLMLRRLNYGVCMQAASANRVKALIIEEIAIDDSDPIRTKADLNLARDLHMESLDLCERTFGMWNIQTAKHFGNLGRLYQSMQNNKEAELMHLKAIMIKERLLGPTDFEVGLSVGHLASLYNYDMDRYKEAEQLYLRSVQINLSLFGPTYSGLEYDYRGLQRVYHELGNHTEMQRYQSLFEYWSRERQRLRATEPIEPTDTFENIDECQLGSREQSRLFSELAKDYESQFRSIFGSLHMPNEVDSLTNSTRRDFYGVNSNSNNNSSMEASRSTGY